MKRTITGGKEAVLSYIDEQIEMHTISQDHANVMLARDVVAQRNIVRGLQLARGIVEDCVDLATDRDVVARIKADIERLQQTIQTALGSITHPETEAVSLDSLPEPEPMVPTLDLSEETPMEHRSRCPICFSSDPLKSSHRLIMKGYACAHEWHTVRARYLAEISGTPEWTS